MARDADRFAAGVLRRYEELRTASRDLTLSKSMESYVRESASATAAAFGHPRFANLPIGATASTHAAAVFLDLDQFTSRTFWDAPDDVSRLSIAVLTELANIVAGFGGYVLGLRGDGLFACFEHPDPSTAVGFAIAASARALDATAGALNNLLELSGIAPVRLRAGGDFGRLDFSRVGSREASEVNAVGFAANFAAKCEKLANSWELIVGQGAAKYLPGSDLTSHEKSPKIYSRGTDTRTYSIHRVAWRNYLAVAEGIPEELAGRSLVDAVQIH